MNASNSTITCHGHMSTSGARVMCGMYITSASTSYAHIMDVHTPKASEASRFGIIAIRAVYNTVLV